MTERPEDVLAEYDVWADDRKTLSAREDDPEAGVSASEWEQSDDDAVNLAHRLAEVLRTVAGVPTVTDKEGLVWRWQVYGPQDAPTAVFAVTPDEDTCWSVTVDTPRTQEQLEAAVKAFDDKYRKEGSS